MRDDEELELQEAISYAGCEWDPSKIRALVEKIAKERDRLAAELEDECDHSILLATKGEALAAERLRLIEAARVVLNDNHLWDLVPDTQEVLREELYRLQDVVADSVLQGWKPCERCEQFADVLRKVQWSSWEYSTGWNRCPLCHGWKPFAEASMDDRMTKGHREDCPIGKLLKD